MQAHLQLVSLDDVQAPSPLDGRSWLTAAEASRLQTLSAPLRRRQYLSGHWLVRIMAARACGGEPGEWSLVADADPRPRLTSPDRPLLWASLSHSGEGLAAAVAHQPLGLDLERPKPGRRLAALSGFVLSAGEAAQVAAAPEGAARSAVFYRYWTLKEAWAKRSGAGLRPTQARATRAAPCAAPEAEAWAWQLPGGGHLALAGWRGLNLSGLPASSSPPSCWRYGADS